VLASGKQAIYHSKRIRYYECRVCNLSINAERMEQWFRDDVGAVTTDERYLQRWVAGERDSGDIREARREIAALECALAPEAIEGSRARVWELALASQHAAADLDRQLARLTEKAEVDRKRLAELRALVTHREGSKRSVEQARRLLADFWPRYERATYEQKRELMGLLVTALGGCQATKDGLIWPRRPGRRHAA
jgi:hypothetical protein